MESKLIKIKRNEEKAINLTQGGNYRIELVGRRGKVRIRGGLTVKRGEELRINLEVRHLARQTESDIFIRAVVGDRAKAKLDGLVEIAKGAEGSRTRLREEALLLGKRAAAEAIPNLEIKTNRVSASHAATIGKIDQGQVFYLKSRGLSGKAAAALIAEGFLNPAKE